MRSVVATAGIRRLEPSLGSTPLFCAETRGPTPSPHPVDRLTRLLAQAAATPVASYCVFDDGKVICLSAHGASAAELETLTVLWQRTLTHDDMVVIEDAAEDVRLSGQCLRHPAAPVRFFAGMPVRDEQGRTLGCVSILDMRPRRFRTEDHTALGDARALLEHEIALRRQAQVDHLTGLPNRHALDELLTREWRRATREGTPMSVLAIDIDHFKAYNDQNGHPAGDVALRQIANAMRQALHRPADVIARTGGEEFLVCLPQTDAAGALKLAEAVRTAVENLALSCVEREPPILTISVGVSTIDNIVERPFSRMALVASADAALYEAKRGGRNRVVVAPSCEDLAVAPAA